MAVVEVVEYEHHLPDQQEKEWVAWIILNIHIALYGKRFHCIQGRGHRAKVNLLNIPKAFSRIQFWSDQANP